MTHAASSPGGATVVVAPHPPGTADTATVPARYRRTVLSNYAYAGALALVALGVTPVLARWLGRAEFGVWVLVGSIAAYLDLLELGVGGATIREVAYHDARGDPTAVRRTIATAFWSLCFVGLLATAVAAGLALAFPLVFDVPEALELPAAIACVLVAGSLAVSIPTDTFGGVLIAHQRYDLLNASLIATLVAQAVGWVVVLALGGGLIALAAVTAGFALVGQSARWWLAHRVVPGLSVSLRLFDRTRIGPLARLSVWFSLSQVAWFVTTRIDVIVVGVVVGVPQAAVYAVGQKLALACTQLVSPLTDAFFPLASALDGLDDRPRLRGAILTGTRISLALALPLALTVALLAEPGVRAWVGGGFDDAALVATLLAVNAAVRTLPSVGIRALAGAGAFRGPAVAFVLEAALNLGASVALGLQLGIVGVALGSLIASAVVQVGYVFPLVARTFDLPIASFVRRELRAQLPAATVTAALGAGALAAGVRGVGPVLGTGAAMVALYLGVVTVTGLDRAERARLLAALWRRREGTGSATDVLLVDPSDRGGLVLYTALVAAGLADAGCAVTVVANRAVDQAACAPAARRVLPAARWGREGAGPLARCRNLARWLAAARAVAWLVLRLGPGVVHFQAPLNRRFDPLLVRLLRGIAPVVLTAHDVIPHEAAAGEERHWKRLYRAVDTVIVLTPPAARAIEQLGVPTPEVVPHPMPAVEPIDRAEARRLLDLPEQDRLLGALGFVRPYKGYGLLAEVWERLGPDAPWLLVLGELVVESEADTLARLGRCPRVILRPGYAGEVELRQAIAACDAVLLPYDGGSDSGLVHLARGLGVPVIASDAAPLAASVRATGAGSVVPRTVEAWAEAVLADLPSPPHPGAPLEVSGREHLAAYESARARWLA